MGTVIEDLIKDLTFAQNVIDNYENRLKADMVAMLEELKSYIELMASLETDPPFAEGEKYCTEIIQQKIDNLKAQTGGNT